ncbi:MAG: hypothetical protein ACRDY1_12630 [Acidimicrobiales bacterium]
MDRLAEILDVTDCQPVPIPIDCTDGIGGAYWGRSEAYLDPDVQEAMSGLAQLDPSVRAVGMATMTSAVVAGTIGSGTFGANPNSTWATSGSPAGAGPVAGSVVGARRESGIEMGAGREIGVDPSENGGAGRR